MTSTFYISPFQPPSFVGESVLNIESQDYSTQLKTRWHDAKVVVFNPILEPETDIVRWDITTSDNLDLQGGLQKDCMVVSLQGNIKGIAEFVVYHRNYVNKEISLFFFDDGLHINIELPNSITESEVVNLLKPT